MQSLTDEERKLRRETWGVYRYTPTAPTKERPFINDQRAFHQSLAKIRIIIGPNRAGKTTPAVNEPAAMLAGGDGGDYPEWWGYPKDQTPKTPLTIWLSSPKLPDLPIGDARLKRLFIGFWFTDPATGERIWMPPLVPRSHLKSPACLDQKGVQTIETINQDIIVLKSAHQLPGSSAGEEPDLILVDEKTDPLVWYEYVARVSQNQHARIIHVLTDDADDNQTDYLAYLKNADPADVEWFRFGPDNPHIDTVHHERVMNLLPPEQKRVRRKGETMAEVRRCYPFANEWRKGFVHTGEVYRNEFGGSGNWVPSHHWPKIDKNWTRYVIHDPGETNPGACAWIAAEPGLNNLWVYRGLYWPEPYANFIDTAREIFDATGDELIRMFMMDPKYGKRHLQFGMDAPRERKRIDLYNAVSSRLLGRPFRWAMAPSGIERMQRSVRIAHLRAYMDPRNNAVPMLWILDDGSPGLEALKTEFDLYRTATSPKGKEANPDRPVKKWDNFIYCLEVAAAMGLQWFPPDGEEMSVLRLKRDMADPDRKLADFMESGNAEGWNETTFM